MKKKQRKNDFLAVRMTSHDRAKVERMAADLGVSESAAVRMAIKMTSEIFEKQKAGEGAGHDNQ
jgi:hypothetical protein